MNPEHKQIIKSIFQPQKGIIALDESVESATKRLAEFGIQSNPESRRNFRSIFIEAQDIEKFVSGVILHEETINQISNSGPAFTDILKHKKIQIGIKVDKGLELYEMSDQQITKGLEDLRERVSVFKGKGATFTKWRSVFKVSPDISPDFIRKNNEISTQYAATVLSLGLVPIIEPEILYAGTHSIEEAEETLVVVVGNLILSLNNNNIDLSNVIIKTSMAMTGKDTKTIDQPEMVAEKTKEALLSSLPDNLGGVVFLSGGQSPNQTLKNFRSIISQGPYPWPMTFSFARAIQEPSLLAWQGKKENMHNAENILLFHIAQFSDALVIAAQQ